MTKSVQLLKDLISLKSNGEERKEQAIAVEEIEKALQTDTNLLLEAPTGSGKALCVETPVLTTEGWKTMGELEPGDYVFGTNGTPTQITHAHDAFISTQTYAITFSSGETIYADKDHLWHFKRTNKELPDNKSREGLKYNEELIQHISERNIYVTTEFQIAPDSDTSPEDVSSYTLLSTLHPNLPTDLLIRAASFCQPLIENEQNIYYSQYELLEQTYVELLNREHTWTTQELHDSFKRDSQEGLHDNIVYTIDRAQPLQWDNSTKLPAPSLFVGEWLAGFSEVFNEAQFKRLQDMGVKDNSRIPDVYKYAEPRHREYLIRGLLRGQKHQAFRTSIKTLAEDVLFVAQSLGYPASLTDMSHFTEDDNKLYAVLIADELPKKEFIRNIKPVDGREVRCITVDADDHLFLAGHTLIPTHNTLSYLIPLVSEGTRAVISTATIQLSEQIIREDVVFLNNALKELKTSKKADVTLLKGRDNYLCLAKHEENRRIADNENTLFGTEETLGEVNEKANFLGQQIRSINEWADETETGDKTDAPAVSDEIWRQFSSTNVECPGKTACPFGDDCFAELARAKASKAPIVVTNHAIVAADLAAEGMLLDERDTFVFDELHELDNYMSKAWGAELTHRNLQQAVKMMKNVPSLKTDLYESLKDLSEQYQTALGSIEVGLIEDGDMSMKLESFLNKLLAVTTKIVGNLAQLEKESSTDSMKRIYNSSKKLMTELRDTAERLCDASIHNVRWTEDKSPKTEWQPSNKRRAKAKNLNEEKVCHLVMKTAPLRIGPKLQSYLTDREATMIGLSATITVGGSMNIPLHTFGLEDKKNNTVVLDTPYDYKKQAMLYIPSDEFPIPVGAERNDHIEAVKKSSAKFIEAAGGRALVLSTTTSNAKAYADYYKDKLDNHVIAQGDGPNSQLISQFKSEHTTTLVGTMGFWHGLDAPGSTCILVVIDKLPFPSPSDPLLLARKNYADKMGRNGFNEIYGTIADWMARQGMGRGVRSKNDKVVIAFYDRRLLTKNYGRAIVHNMYGIGVYRDEQKVLAAMGRLAAMSEEQEKN